MEFSFYRNDVRTLPARYKFGLTAEVRAFLTGLYGWPRAIVNNIKAARRVGGGQALAMALGPLILLTPFLKLFYNPLVKTKEKS